jgi:hypothetical protein
VHHVEQTDGSWVTGWLAVRACSDGDWWEYHMWQGLRLEPSLGHG